MEKVTWIAARLVPSEACNGFTNIAQAYCELEIDIIATRPKASCHHRLWNHLDLLPEPATLFMFFHLKVIIGPDKMSELTYSVWSNMHAKLKIRYSSIY